MTRPDLRTRFPQISWDALSVRENERRQFLVSGEFHYFRVPRSAWKERLELWKACGGKTVATYVPWLLHEPQEGTFRFGGESWLELERFLEECREAGLGVLVRPGPYQYSELHYGGLPEWLFKNYPNILATDAQGKRRSYWSVSYLHPVFLSKVERWFDEVCSRLSPYHQLHGGPIVMVQFDNELTGVHDWFGGWDYNRETIGLGQDDGRYARFLRTRYSSVEVLNTAYETSFFRFDQVSPIEGRALTTIPERRRVRDYALFYYGMVAEYANILMELMTKRGLPGPYVHNAASPYMNSFFKETVEQAKSAVLLGSDHYFNLNLDWDQNNPTPKYAAKCWFSMETLRLLGCPPTIWEMPAGSCSDWPPITGTDLKACYMMHVAQGIKGVNYYIFTGGPNPPGAGATSDLYDYGAPISADGAARPSYQVLKEYHRFLADNDWLAAAQGQSDFYLGLDWEQSRSSHYFAGRGDMELSGAEAWTLARKGVLISAWCGSRSVKLVDFSKRALLEKTDKPLWVCASPAMSRERQRLLVEFANAGGRLIIGPILPYLDDDFQPCTVLKDFVGAGAIVRCSSETVRLHVGPVKNVFVPEQLFRCESISAAATPIALEEKGQATCGWRIELPSGGQVIWYGLQWKHSQREHSAAVCYLLRLAGIDRGVLECDNPNVWATFRSDGSRGMVFLMNLFTEQMTANVSVRIGESAVSMGAHQLMPMQVKAVEIEIGRSTCSTQPQS